MIPLEKRNHRWLKREAWSLFSKFIRNRDPVCFTCPEKTAHSGHWRHGHGKVGFFSDINVNGQCAKCNLYLSGNLGVYSLKMSKIHGQEKAEKLWKDFSKDHNWTRKELISIIKKYVPLK